MSFCIRKLCKDRLPLQTVVAGSESLPQNHHDKDSNNPSSNCHNGWDDACSLTWGKDWRWNLVRVEKQQNNDTGKRSHLTSNWLLSCHPQKGNIELIIKRSQKHHHLKFSWDLTLSKRSIFKCILKLFKLSKSICKFSAQSDKVKPFTEGCITGWELLIYDDTLRFVRIHHSRTTDKRFLW